MVEHSHVINNDNILIYNFYFNYNILCCNKFSPYNYISEENLHDAVRLVSLEDYV
jgi:hypothetical protein